MEILIVVELLETSTEGASIGVAGLGDMPLNQVNKNGTGPSTTAPTTTI